MSEPLERLRADLAAGLAARREAGLLRTLRRPAGIDLSSNDYLGYATDPWIAERVAEAVREHGVGSGAARLLRGHTELFEEAEAALAAFSGREAALLFPSGYSANVGLVPALAGEDDVVLSDAENHASLVDGARLSSARRVVLPHGDLDALERALRAPRRGRAVVLVESVYSARGDLADLAAICDLADEHGGVVLVDEAHATGLHGARGSGRVEALGLSRRVAATIHTGGKALGVAGAWVAGDRVLVEHLMNHARSFVFTTAPMPALPAGLLAALERRGRDVFGVASMHRKAARLRERLAAEGFDLAGSASQIVPVVLGSNEAATSLAAALQRDGFDVRALRPPTVPEGRACLRVTVRAPVADADLDRFAESLVRHAGARAR